MTNWPTNQNQENGWPIRVKDYLRCGFSVEGMDSASSLLLGYLNNFTCYGCTYTWLSGFVIVFIKHINEACQQVKTDLWTKEFRLNSYTCTFCFSRLKFKHDLSPLPRLLFTHIIWAIWVPQYAGGYVSNLSECPHKILVEIQSELFCFMNRFDLYTRLL